MTLSEQVFAQTQLLTGELDQQQTELLRLLCGITTASLTQRLKDGLSPGDCRADFVAAASLFALSALNGSQDSGNLEEFKAGDLSIKKGGGTKDAASRCLERQAELIISPYLKDRFAFVRI